MKSGSIDGARMKKLALAALAVLAISPLWAMEDHEPSVWAVKVDELEGHRQSGGSGLAWHVAVGGGTDLDQVWLETEGERTGGSTDEHEISLYYRRALTPFWNLHAGWRGDRGHGAGRDWLLVGLRGDAPFHIDTGLDLYVGDNDRAALEVELEKVFRVTRRWLFVPGFEATFHSRDDAAAATGSGLSRIEAAVRLGYELTPRLVPYAGLVWEKNQGNTARYLRDEGRRTEAGRIVLGVRFWL